MNLESLKSLFETSWENGGDPLATIVMTEGFYESDPRDLVRFALYLYSTGKVDDAVKVADLIEARRIEIPKSARMDLEYMRCEALMDQENFSDAVKTCDRIISIEQTFPALCNRAVSNWELGNLDLALSDYSKAIAVDPANADAFRWAGEVLNELDRSDEAIKALEKSVRLDPLNAKTLTELGIAYFNTGEWSKAHKSLSNALRINPGSKLAALGIRKLEESSD